MPNVNASYKHTMAYLHHASNFFRFFFLNASHLALKFLTHLFYDLWDRLIIFD